MRMAALLMAMIALLGSPQGEGTVSETMPLKNQGIQQYF